MPAAARGNKTDDVDVVHGVGIGCGDPFTYKTDKCSGNVIINGDGVVRKGDAMQLHPTPPLCIPHAPGLDSFSSTVFANGKNCGRKGDTFSSGHDIVSGSGNVFIGG
tara:strand:- start:1258 stop:1578 length:321 start_codon:yes stop_codon:yes gene_type:complete